MSNSSEEFAPKVGDEVLFHLKGGKSIPEYYQLAIIKYIGSRHFIFKSETGREYCRRKTVKIKDPIASEKKILADIQRLIALKAEYNCDAASALMARYNITPKV